MGIRSISLGVGELRGECEYSISSVEYFMGSGTTSWGVGVLHGEWEYFMGSGSTPLEVGVLHEEWEYSMKCGSSPW